MSKNEFNTRVAIITDELNALKHDAPEALNDIVTAYVDAALGHITSLDNISDDSTAFNE